MQSLHPDIKRAMADQPKPVAQIVISMRSDGTVVTSYALPNRFVLHGMMGQALADIEVMLKQPSVIPVITDPASVAKLNGHDLKG